MNQVFLVHVVQAKCDLDENLPNEVFREALSILLLDELAEVRVRTVLKHQVDHVVLDECVVETHDVGAV